MTECYVCGDELYFEHEVLGYLLCEKHYHEATAIVLKHHKQLETEFKNFLKAHKDRDEVTVAYA